MANIGRGQIQGGSAPAGLLSDAMAARWVLALIVGTAFLRLGFGWATGLGVDESYMVAAGRTLHGGYFDHPPASWWLSGAAASLAGSESPIVVRLPFILLFCLTTWLMYRLARRLYGAEAGLWAVVTLNLAPVFGVTTASWVLPDGPLDAALAGAALALVHALQSEGGVSRRWWLASGGSAGLALFSKYSAVLTMAGAAIYLLSQPAHRRWLARPDPYLAAGLAALVFAPVIWWNARHGWASFAFQGSRAEGGSFRPLAALTTLGGEAVYLLPWLWLPLLACLGRALARGPSVWPDWLLACLGAPPVLLFFMIAAWSSQRVLPHWAAPGYLMLFPMLGERIAHWRAQGRRWPGRTLAGTAAFVLAGVALVSTEIRYAWLPGLSMPAAPASDPTMEAVDWTQLADILARRGLLDPARIVAATNWRDAGKIGHALAGAVPVICLNTDAREFGLDRPVSDYFGRDILIVMRAKEAAYAQQRYGLLFAHLDELPPVILDHAGHPALALALVLGHDLRDWPGTTPSPPGEAGSPSRH